MDDDSDDDDDDDKTRLEHLHWPESSALQRDRDTPSISPVTFLFITKPVKRRSHSHPQGRKKLLASRRAAENTRSCKPPLSPRGVGVRTLCLVLVSYVTHKGLAEHKGYTYRQAVYSSGLWLCSLLQCEKKKKRAVFWLRVHSLFWNEKRTYSTQ